MARNTKRLFCSTALVAIGACLLSGAASAQTAQPSQTKDNAGDTVVDEIVVTGIRGSIVKSINDKRKSGKIVDTVNAEDIGKTTDQNIADALNRISGVSTSTNDGQGSFVSVRGANADQTVVTMNGVTLGSTGFSQGVDLSAYSAAILSKVEVVKTPSADDEEGSLAAVVNLITRKPLDVKENIRTFSAQGRYNALSKDFDHRLTGTFSQKLFDDRFGVLFTVYDEANKVQREQQSFENYNVFQTNAYTDQNGKAYVNNWAFQKDAQNALLHNRANAFAGAQSVDTGACATFATNATPCVYRPIAYGLAPETAAYEYLQNNYTRTGVDGSVQFEFTPRNRLTLSGTYNKQKFRSRNSAVFVSTQRFPGVIDNVDHPNLGLGAPFRDRTIAYDASPISYGGTVQNFGDPVTNPTLNDSLMWTDPVQKWVTLDTKTRTFTQYRNRFETGGTRESINNYDSTNLLFSGEFESRLTDKLRFVAGASYAKSKQDPKDQIYMIANRVRTVGPWNLHQVPADALVPAGYDCSSGACALVGGATTPFLGKVIDPVASQDDLWDNIGRTGFNPDDLPSHTLSYISTGFTKVADEQKVAFADFDWDTDFAGIRSIEFGGKYTKRSKFVDQQTGTPRASKEFIQVISPFTGQTIVLDPQALNLISASVFSQGPLPTNSFGEGIGLPRDNITDGWQTFDPVKALAAVAQGSRDFTLDRTQTRGADFANFSGYLKFNFSYFDDRLRGDIGVRHVRTKVNTSGFAGAIFAFDTQGAGRVIDPIALANIRNANPNNPCPVLSETPSPVGLGPSSQFWTNALGDGNANDARNYNLTAYQQRNREARVDGLGRSAAVPGGVCYDPLLQPGALPNTFRERYLVRYSDISTEQFGTQFFSGLADHSRASIAATDEYKYNVWLPNLNLSFIVNNEMVARASAYRTMSRPPIDDLRAGFRATEGNIFEGTTAFRPGSTVNLYSAKVKPLVADNFDVAFEWYFKPESLVSINVFYKNINNLIETADSRWYIGDLRNIAADPAKASFDGVNLVDSTGTSVPLLLTNSGGQAQPDINSCMPRRIQGEGTIVTAESWLFSNDGRLLCDEYNVTRRVNAGKATVRGVELQFIHNFRSLPGILQYLGVAANYTYQKGEYEDSRFPIAGTPRHSYNATGYWQKGGNQLRLAYSGNSDSLLQRSFAGGALWQEGRDVLDFSASFQITRRMSFTFDAQNITDSPVRSYFTSRIIRLPDATGAFVNFDEGTIFDGATKSRTIQKYNTGTNFRAGVRLSF
ncbi:TonB-dependent receptor [Caulobacter sp. X]|uniref:TonB-dependent receptor n=1 Tax=Caulobacter sp. X TaxID=2048901 RepID=UPI001374741E|nr:TonB-dependent receptor [Caulobacter sp. X]